MSKALIFDTETSGLLRTRLIPLENEPQIIELYAALIDLRDGEIINEFESYFHCSKPLDKEVIKVTKITDDMIKDAPVFRKHADHILHMIESAPLVIAHNASFDKEMIDIEFERLDIKVKWPRVLCSVEQTIHLKGYRLPLWELYQYLFGEKFADAHRAKNDTMALIKCCCELHKRGVL